MDEQVYFQALLNEFGTRLYLDPQLRQIMKKIEQGKADFSDTAHLSERASNLLGEVFGANVADIPAEAREAVCTALLKDRYDSMNGTLAAVQEALDEPLGLHLTPQKAPFPSERVEQLAHSLVDPTVKPETIQRRANQPVATVAKSFHDDYIKTNARFRNRLGLKPVIKRFGVGCCQWCAEVAGTYRFGEQPEDVFRRHDNCGCVIIYDTQVLWGAKTADGGSSRAWTEVDPSDLQQNPPASLSQEEARELERFARQRLTFAGERDIISGRGSGTRAASDTIHYFERIGKLDPDNKKAIAASLAEFERKYKDSPIEHCRVITATGEVYEVHGDRYRVDTTLLGNLMNGSTNEHNHVTGESQYSFSWEDLIGSVNDGSANALAFDEKFRYAMTFPKASLSEDKVYEAYRRANESVGNDMIFYPERIPEGDEQHERIRRACESLGIQYRRTSITR